MWARAVEVMLALWLAASPFIFGHSPAEPRLWWNDLVCAGLIMTLSLFSFWSRTTQAHLLNIAVALWLMGFGYFGFGYPPPPAAQNDFALGILLLMLAIIPSHATQPPKRWIDYEARRKAAV